MTQRPGSARGGLTLAQAQELILARALASRAALSESQGASPAQPFTSVAEPYSGQPAPALTHDDIELLESEFATGEPQLPDTNGVVGGLAKHPTMWSPGSGPEAGQDTLYRRSLGIGPEREGHMENAVLRGDGAAQITLIGNPHNPRLKREWERANGVQWPRDPVTGRPYDVGHKRALADGGANTLDNIEPVPRGVHTAQHKANGDYARWARRQWIARAFGGRVVRGLGAFGLIPNITGMLSGRIRTDTFDNFTSDMTGVPSPEDVRRQNEELRKRYFPNSKPGGWVA